MDSTDGHTTMATLADRIGELLTKRDMSQQGLERAARLSRGYVTRIRKGERVRIAPDILQRIADVLEVSYQWLATGRGTATRSATEMAVAHYRPASMALDSLEAAIAYHAGKWGTATVAATRAMAADSPADLSPKEWTEKLDEIEALLRSVSVTSRPGRARR